MGSCCSKKTDLVHSPESIRKSISITSQPIKRYPTSIKIIPASPSRSSLIESPSSKLQEAEPDNPVSSKPQAEAKKPRPRNLLDLIEKSSKTRQIIKSEGEKNLLKRSGHSLNQPAESSLLNESHIELIIETSNLKSGPKHIRRVSHSYFRQISNLSAETNTASSINRKLVKSKSLDGKKKINQYTFIKVLGRGAFGKVWEAEDENKNCFAVKVLNKRILRNRWIGKKKTAYDSIKTEIAVMKKVKHNNAVKLFEVIDDESSAKMYLVIEHAPGGNLYEKSPFDVVTARNYFTQFMDVLDYLHNSLSIVHRDIKPQNLLVGNMGVLKLCDFGASQFVFDMNDELTNSAGTFAFMPPEAYKNTSYRGKPADVWAAGITLYYMLTGRSPFINKSYHALILEIDSREVELPGGFDEEVQDLIRKMTCKDPFKRIEVKEVKLHNWLKIEKN